METRRTLYGPCSEQVNDISIVVLAEPVDSIAPLPLAANASQRYVHREASVYGFGIYESYDPAGAFADRPPTSNNMLSGIVKVETHYKPNETWPNPVKPSKTQLNPVTSSKNQ